MDIKNRRLFRVSRFIMLKLPWLLRIFSGLKTASKRILIIKPDAIGDYILFRNFLQVVKDSKKFSGYRIDLLGNNLWQDLAKEYDTETINQFIFIKPNSYYESPWQLLKLTLLLFKRNYTLVLNPNYSRTLFTDGIAALTGSKNLVGFTGDTERIAVRYKKQTDCFYQTQLNLPENIYFEFDRTKFFFEQILQEKISLKKAFLPVKHSFKKDTIILFPGAGFIKRNWEIEKFAEIIELIISNTNYKIVLAGGKSEEEIGNYLTEKFKSDRTDNQINQTSLVQLTNLIASSNLVIANETSAVHIASACNIPNVCILGGGHFNRFAPYPKEIEPDCAYEVLPCFNCNWNCKFETAKEAPYPCISIVSVEQVWDKIIRKIKFTNNN